MDFPEAHFRAKGRRRHLPTPGSRESFPGDIYVPYIKRRHELARILLVGVGGIGSEVLKNLALHNFRFVEIVDLDTVELTNLNRQLFFRREHIGMSKAFVAREAAMRVSPGMKIVAYNSDITNEKFDVRWFKRFSFVISALDNLSARRHVNLMCMASNVPLVESGSAGFKGQVTLHIKNKTKCYDCDPHAVPKSYPACTIRNNPSTAAHCVIWAKNYVFETLFGISEEGLSFARENTNKEDVTCESFRHVLASEESTGKLFDYLFYESVKDAQQLVSSLKERNLKPLKWENFALLLRENNNPPPRDLNPSHICTLRENVERFSFSYARLNAEFLSQKKENAFLVFEKNREDMLDFIASAANIRAHVYGIEQKSRFEIKEIAGRIIPAVATTNAIISGLVVLVILSSLFFKNAKNVWVSDYICPEKLSSPNTGCKVCTQEFFTLFANTKTSKLKEVLELCTLPKKSGGLELLGEISIQEGVRLLYDEDFESNLDSSLDALKISHGKRLSVYSFSESGTVSVLLDVRNTAGMIKMRK